MAHWEHRLWLPKNFTGQELAGVADLVESPVEKAALPELAKVQADCEREFVFLHDVPRLNFVPCDEVLVVSLNWGGRRQTQEELWWCGWFWTFARVEIDDGVDDEVLASGPDDWSECLLQLPVDLIIEHVQENYGLISDGNVWIAHKLDKQLFNQIESALVVRYLCHEKSSLNLLKVLVFLVRISLAFLEKAVDVLLVIFFSEWELLDVHDDLLHCGSQTE